MVFPWSVVLLNAPLIADTAQKLWAKLVKGQVPAEGAPKLEATLASQSQMLALVGGRLDALESTTSGLQSAVLEASKLLDALAQQNLVMVERVEALRRRQQILQWSGIVVTGAVLVAWVWQRSVT